MRRLIPLLSAVLVLQVAVAVWLGATTKGVGGAATSEPLLRFDAKAVDRITLERPSDPALVLERKNDAWQLPGLGGFPASQAKVQDLIGRLEGLRRRVPVATSAAALERFKVSPQAFEHKVVLAAAERPVATLWLGDTPGFRRVYGRAEGADAVYDLELPVHELAARPADWADPSYLHLEEDKIARVALAGLGLEREDGQWRVQGLGARERTNEEQARSLVGRLARLRFVEVLGTEARPEYRLEAPVLEIALTTRDGQSYTYAFSRAEAGTDYVLKRSDSPYYFKVAEHAVKPLQEASRDKLVLADPEPPAAGEAAAAGGAPVDPPVVPAPPGAGAGTAE